MNPPSFSNYVPMIVHVLSVLVVFYFARMYHQRRAVSRIDEAYAVAQNVSIGTFLAVAFETLAFKNSALELDYPRGVVIYAWLLSIVLVVVGRMLLRFTTVACARRASARQRADYRVGRWRAPSRKNPLVVAVGLHHRRRGQRRRGRRWARCRSSATGGCRS